MFVLQLRSLSIVTCDLDRGKSPVSTTRVWARKMDRATSVFEVIPGRWHNTTRNTMAWVSLSWHFLAANINGRLRSWNISSTMIALGRPPYDVHICNYFFRRWMNMSNKWLTTGGMSLWKRIGCFAYGLLLKPDKLLWLMRWKLIVLFNDSLYSFEDRQWMENWFSDRKNSVDRPTGLTTGVGKSSTGTYFSPGELFLNSLLVMMQSDALETAMKVEHFPYLCTVYPSTPSRWTMFYFPAISISARAL